MFFVGAFGEDYVGHAIFRIEKVIRQHLSGLRTCITRR
jgi:hypothetical protein